MPVTLGLISHRACALGLPKGKIQYMADLAQNWAETGLGGFWDLGKCQGNRQEVRDYFCTLRGKRASFSPSKMMHDSPVEIP